MKLAGMIAAGLVALGCTSVLRGPDTCAEIHLDATYVMARWAGWTPEEARRIAAADAWTDQHAETNSVATERRILGGLVNPLTIPRILCAGLGDVLTEGEPPRRAFGRRTAEATAWAVPALGHRLHFPSAGMRSPVSPAFYLNPSTGDLEYGNAEARRVLERAFVDLLAHDDDSEATLALLGIGLHTLQDSYKHQGFCPAMGHIGARPDPDRACGDLCGTMACAEATLKSLRYARRLAVGRSAPPPADWKDRLQGAFCRCGEEGSCIRECVPEDDTGRESLLLQWKSEGGEEHFERALVRVREVLR